MQRTYFIISIVVVVIIVLIGLVFAFGRGMSEPNNDDRVPPPSLGDGNAPATTSPNSQQARTFSGTLESVDTGCYADAECAVTVSGKRVVAITGMRAAQVPVGKVLGVDDFGALEQRIGSPIEVYALLNPDGTYTLYGDESYYIRVGVGTTTPRSVPGTPGGTSSSSSAGSAPSASMPPQDPNAARASGGCVIGGCSSQLCVDGANAPVMSTCEYQESYACYQTASCARQSNGQCGWTQTTALTQCLANARGASRPQVQ